MILIADSGSTKTEWVTSLATVTTKGINPVRDSIKDIMEVVNTELMPKLFPRGTKTCQLSNVTEIHFYGAGCIPPYSQSIQQALLPHFPSSTIHIYSDLLGAARALCGTEEGIACILGTGSNSCLCRNGEIVSNTPAMGYILGDEGSGAVLGRTLLSELTKGKLQELWPDFTQSQNLTITDIIDRVYRQPQPNRFLASLTPFILEKIHNTDMREMVVNEFVRFLQRNVIPYKRPELPVNFVGGIANAFAAEIQEACCICNLKMGAIIAKPAKSLHKFHIHDR